MWLLSITSSVYELLVSHAMIIFYWLVINIVLLGCISLHEKVPSYKLHFYGSYLKFFGVIYAGIFERFRGILHEGEIDKRVQFLIEGLFAIRKAKFQVFANSYFLHI